jgi:hypothetical protein
VRIAHRIRDLQALPYAAVMQEGVTKVYEVRFVIHNQPTDRHCGALQWQLYFSAFEKYTESLSTEKRP